MYTNHRPSPTGSNIQSQSNQSPTGSSRFFELLDALRVEYEATQQDFSLYKMQRDDIDLKLQCQVGDFSVLQKALLDLEKNHIRIKQQYEDEIERLKGELELVQSQKNTLSNVSGISAMAAIKFPTVPNLEAEIAATMSGQGTLPFQALGSDPLAPPLQHGPNSTISSKRQAIDEENNMSRNVRLREDKKSFLSSKHQSVSIQPNTYIPQQVSSTLTSLNSSNNPSNYPLTQPSNYPLTQPSNHPSSQFSNHSPNVPPPIANHQPETGKKESAGYDWLVVYNPKVTRSVSIELMHNLPHESVVCCVKFSPNGCWLATGGNRIINIYNVQTGEKIMALKDEEQQYSHADNRPPVDQYVRSIAFTPDGRTLVSGSEDRIIRIWDLRGENGNGKSSGSNGKGICMHRIEGHEQDIYAVDVTPDGKEIVSGSGDRTVRVWSIESGKCRLELMAATLATDSDKEAGITSVSISTDGKYIAAGSLDRIVRIWEMKHGKLICSLEGHKDSVYSVSFSPDGNTLITGSLDKSIRMWNLGLIKDALNPAGLPDNEIEPQPKISCKYTILGHKDYVLSVVATPPDGRWIISGSKDRSVQVWDATNGATQLMLQGHKNSVICVAVSPLGTVFATASGDLRARIWSFSSHQEKAIKDAGIPPHQPLQHAPIPKSMDAAALGRSNRGQGHGTTTTVNPAVTTTTTTSSSNNHHIDDQEEDDFDEDEDGELDAED